MCRTGVTCIFTFLHNSSEGMFLCLPEELYILSAFFVRHVHSEIFEVHVHVDNRETQSEVKYTQDTFTVQIC